MLKRPHPGAGTVNTIGVASLDAALAQVDRAGGKTVVPKMPIPGVGHLAYCRDTEGNTFAVLQADPVGEVTGAKQLSCAAFFPPQIHRALQIIL